jgi:predicted ATPase
VTQEQLAESTGLSVRGISDLERGARSVPQRETILRLIEGLQLTAGEEAALLTAARRAWQARAGAMPPRGQFTPGAEAVAPDAFVGRAVELTAIIDALHDPGSRLLTLTGPPGVGKTRLALEATRRLAALLPDEIIAVDLAPLRSPLLVLPAIAAAAGLRESAAGGLLVRLGARLASRPAVLLLDNFEHLLAAVPVVSDLLEASGDVRLLVTSRESLRVRGEQALPVPPLATPPLASEMNVRDVVNHEAVSLFVMRARAHDQAFHLCDENARAIAELCVRLDGLPLAIELAAARIELFAPAAILERLSRRLPILTAEDAALPDRHRTLADAIAWSYELLREDERRLLRLLSVFIGGFSLEAAEAVTNTVGGLDSFGGLASLADKNLIVRQSGQVSQVRFTMLETIREFALEQLTAHGEEAAVRAAHTAYFLAFAGAAEREVRAGPAQAAAIARLEGEHDNLRLALDWSLAQTDPMLSLRLCEALWRFWWIQGHLSEGQYWLERALERAQEAPPAALARTLIAAARLAWLRGELALASERLAAALALGPDVRDRCEGLNAVADVARHRGHFAEADAALTEAIALERADEDWWYLGASLHNLGTVALERGDHDRAQAALEESLACARRVENRYLAYSTLHYLSRLAFEQGDYARAAALRQEDLAVQRELAPVNPHGAARCLEGIAMLAVVRNQPQPAARLFGAAAALREEADDIEGLERKQVEPWLATAREAFGEDAFEAAWMEGRDLPVEEALAQAASLLERWNWTPRPQRQESGATRRNSRPRMLHV